MQMDPQVPSELDGYRPLEFIGRGGMGEVWLANNLRLAKPCVLKILRPPLARQPTQRRRFFREAEIGVSLEHGRIVSVLDFGEAQGYLYLVLEFIDGIDLTGFCRALDEGGVSLPMVAVGYVMGEVFEALNHAHNRVKAGKPSAVIHRDVTPSNVLISSAGEVFLTDFGIARYAAEARDEAIGTLQYMAPEQARGQACLGSDLYGAAGVLHFMLTGEPPRQVDDADELEPLLDTAPPTTGRDDVPEPLEKIRVMGLEPDPRRRIRSANDALALIDSWDGYGKATRLLARFYQRYIGPPHSGLTRLLKAAEVDRTQSAAVAQEPNAPPSEESARMTVKVARRAEHGERSKSVVRGDGERSGLDGQGTEGERPGAGRRAGREARVAGGSPPGSADPSTEADDNDGSWIQCWWPGYDDPEEPDSKEEQPTQRYLPPANAVEPDAPRVLRRPHRSPLDPLLDHEPQTPEVG